ncbi:MAG: hypothetical protein AB7K09_23980 [Planctomycetota bacterium]
MHPTPSPPPPPLRTVAIIPAKGTSRRLPGKNRRPLAGKPLFLYTVEAAQRAGIPEVLVTSEAGDILELARRAGATAVPRPRVLAGNWPDLEVVRDHALQHVNVSDATHDAVFMLLPTWPFRAADDIRLALRLLATGLISEVRSGTVIDRCAGLLLPHSWLTATLLPAARKRLGVPGQLHSAAWLGTDHVRGIDIDDDEDWARAERALPRFDFERGYVAPLLPAPHALCAPAPQKED